MRFASAFKAQIHFGQSSGQTSQQELVLEASVTGGADISGVAKIELEGSIEKHFAETKNSVNIHDEDASIEVPAHTKQVYTIVWREERREGMVEYTENGETKSANFSYRIGLELASSTAKDIPCPFLTETPLVRHPCAIPTPTALPPKPIAQGCISSQNWKPIANDNLAFEKSLLNSEGCYSLEPMGIYADRAGVLHINLRNRKEIASGIFTPYWQIIL